MPDLLLELPSSLENTLTHLQDAVSGCAELALLGVMFERSGMFACGAIELAQFPVRRPGAPCPVLLRDFSSGQTSCRPRRSPSRSSCPSASVPPSALAATPSDCTYASFRPHTVGTAHTATMVFRRLSSPTEAPFSFLTSGKNLLLF